MITKYTSEIFDVLRKGQFICSNSPADDIQKLYKILEDDETFVNLASQEYFKVINKKLLKVPIISPVFKDYKNGKLKIISFFAKKARGSMARYLIDTDAKNGQDILGFDRDEYRYSEQHTEKENEPVFIR